MQSWISSLFKYPYSNIYKNEFRIHKKITRPPGATQKFHGATHLPQ